MDRSTGQRWFAAGLVVHIAVERSAGLREGIGCCQTAHADRRGADDEDDDMPGGVKHRTFSFLVSISFFFLTSGVTKSICFYPQHVR
jgi:hypothetical protein